MPAVLAAWCPGPAPPQALQEVPSAGSSSEGFRVTATTAPLPWPFLLVGPFPEASQGCSRAAALPALLRGLCDMPEAAAPCPGARQPSRVALALGAPNMHRAALSRTVCVVLHCPASSACRGGEGLCRRSAGCCRLTGVRWAEGGRQGAERLRWLWASLLG